MSKTINFCKRNFKEVLRDPIIYIMCLGFPIIMLVLFNIINSYSKGNTPMFNINALLPAIIMFSYSFTMLTLALIVSKDKETFFLKRLFSSPMKNYNYILGYAIVGLVIGVFQSIICVLASYILSIINKEEFISLNQIILVFFSQMPVLIICVFLGILVGVLFNDKTAPAVCSIFISLSGILGGCWMPLESMGKLEVFCKCLPFYPSVYIGRIITKATNSLGAEYVFNSKSYLLFIPIIVFMLTSIIFSIIAFNKSMISDK